MFLSDAESLKQGIIKTFQHGVEEPYTILLVGGPGVGKSAVVQFIANVLLGTDINHYDLDILGRTNGPGDSGDQSRTNGAHLYEFKSRNGIVVGCSFLELVSRCNSFPRFAFSIHLVSPRPATPSRTSSTGKE